MILIFGGVYQGKLDYALANFGLDGSHVYTCSDTSINMPCGKVIYQFDQWILALVQENENVEEKVQHFIEENKDAIVICNDVSGGVVPIDSKIRKWREETGRAMGKLAQQSDEVIRLFCGITSRIK